MHYSVAALVVASFLIPLPALAGPISGLTDTGAGLSAGQIDSNYRFSVLAGTAPGTPSGPDLFGVVGSGWPTGNPWTTSNVGQAKWLSPVASAGQSYDPSTNGIYGWSLTFDLTGYNAATASFSGNWAADNGGVVKLNGIELAGSAIDSNTDAGFTHLTAFSANQGFNAGINTLSFEVTNRAQNGGNPTGVLADFVTSNVSPVPESGTSAMMLAGLGLLGFIRRKKSA